MQNVDANLYAQVVFFYAYLQACVSWSARVSTNVFQLDYIMHPNKCFLTCSCTQKCLRIHTPHTFFSSERAYAQGFVCECVCTSRLKVLFIYMRKHKVSVVHKCLTIRKLTVHTNIFCNEHVPTHKCFMMHMRTQECFRVLTILFV